MKNNKNNWTSRKKQIDALNTLKIKELEAIKDNKSDDNQKLLKYKDIFNKLSNERMGEIHNIGKQIDFNNLTYYFKNKKISPINFIGFRGPLHIYNNIKNGNTSLEKIDKDKKQFQSKVNNITTEIKT